MAPSAEPLLQSDGADPTQKRYPEYLRPKYYVLYAVAMIDFGGAFMVAPLLPRIASVVGATKLQIALMGTIWAVGMVVGLPISGGLSDYISRKVLMVVCAFVLGVAYFVMAFTTDIRVMLVCRFFHGVFSATVGMVITTIQIMTPIEERPGMLQFVYSLAGICLVLGPGIGGFLAIFGFTTALVTTGLCCVLNGLLLIILVPRIDPKDSPEAAASKKAAVESGGSSDPMRAAWDTLKGDPILFLIMLASFMSNLCVAMVIFLPVIMHDVFGWEPYVYGLNASLSGLLLSVYQVFLAPFTSHWRLATLSNVGGLMRIMFIAVCAAYGWDAGFFGNSSIPFWLYLSALTISNSMIEGGLGTMVANSVPEHCMGTINGLLWTCKVSGDIFGPILAQHIYSRATPFRPFVGQAVVSFIAIAFTWEPRGARSKRLEIEKKTPLLSVSEKN